MKSFFFFQRCKGTYCHERLFHDLKVCIRRLHFLLFFVSLGFSVLHFRIDVPFPLTKKLLLLTIRYIRFFFLSRLTLQGLKPFHYFHQISTSTAIHRVAASQSITTKERACFRTVIDPFHHPGSK